jgi:hypothetical protein
MGDPIHRARQRVKCLLRGHIWQAYLDEPNLICARCGKRGASSQSYSRTSKV